MEEHIPKRPARREVYYLADMKMTRNNTNLLIFANKNNLDFLDQYHHQYTNRNMKEEKKDRQVLMSPHIVNNRNAMIIF